jgi:hypothetical protein
MWLKNAEDNRLINIHRETYAVQFYINSIKCLFAIPLHYSSRFQTCLCTYISATVQDPMIMNIEYSQMLHDPLMEETC